MIARAAMLLGVGGLALAVLAMRARSAAAEPEYSGDGWGIDPGGWDYGMDYAAAPVYAADAPAWDWTPAPEPSPVFQDPGYSVPAVPYIAAPAPAWSQETNSALGAYYDRRLPPEPAPAAEGEGAADWIEDPMGYTGFEVSGEEPAMSDDGEIEIDNRATIKAKLPASLRANVDNFDPYVVSAAGRYGVRPEIVRALIYQESRYKPDAKAPGSSATGLMQMTKAAAAEVGYPDINAMFDPASAIDAGTAYLGKMIARFGERDGIRAYYAGPGTISNERKTDEPTKLSVEADRYFAGVTANV